MGLRLAVRVIGFLLLGCCVWAQDRESAPLSGPGISFQGSPPSKWSKPSSESQSMLPDAPTPQPITQADKFQAFVEEARSPLIFGAAGLNAMALREAQDHAAPGMQSSFYTLYEASVVQRESSAFLGKFLYPSLLKQDPRYYPSTSQSFMGRTAYAASRLLITRNDAGKATLNTSYLLGSVDFGRRCHGLSPLLGPHRFSRVRRFRLHHRQRCGHEPLPRILALDPQ